MNDADAQKFRGLIMARLEAIGRETHDSRASRDIVALDQQAIGRVTRMDALQAQAMANAQQSRREIEAMLLELALTKIDCGEYGYCEDCGEPIPQKRLHLELTATNCLSCAQG